jgi:integrin alpha 8
VGNSEKVKLSSLMASRVTRLPFIGQPEKMKVKTYEVITEILATDTPHYKPDYVPWWVVVLSACAGAAILILLVFLLWKVRLLPNRPKYSYRIYKISLTKAIRWKKTCAC